MDIESGSENQLIHSIFLPIGQFPTQCLYQQQVTLENTFLAAPSNHQPSILLTLIKDTLLLSDPNLPQVQPHAALNFNFDLKFEVLHQVSKNIFSPKIGIRLFYDEQKSFFVYSPHLAVIEAWVCCLSKKLNQKGFH